MKEVNIAFLWHMHQPQYRNLLTKECSLPWVRLHGIKGYYDMLSILSNYPEIKVTINWVPSLLNQIMDYTVDNQSDKFMDATLKPAKELDEYEKSFILRYFFMCNWETMVTPSARYNELLRKRGKVVTPDVIRESIKNFSVQDFLDLQVLFNLSWFGFSALEQKPALNELKSIKGKYFTEEDKKNVILLQKEILAEIIPKLKELAEQKRIEVTTSPFYHPILPLLADTESAKRALPGITLPAKYSFPQDASAQIKRAMEFNKEFLNFNINGVWPPEGSVSPEIIPVLADAGIKWMASDEEILLHSLHTTKREVIYKPYNANVAGREINIIFRDKIISDCISFTYSKNKNNEDSVRDFMSKLNSVYSDVSDSQLIPIILDGENPWEYYYDGGKGFLNGIYSTLSKEKKFKTVKISDFLKENKPVNTVSSLYTGSWISHNFDIWIGAPEENKAWEYLGKARNYLEQKNKTDKNYKKAFESLMAAEGSDWFWWFGDHFFSDHEDEFDRIFRSHLSNVYLAYGDEIPEEFLYPINFTHEIKPAKEPLGLISPNIDGFNTHYYEWQNAGHCILRGQEGAMHWKEIIFSSLYYGFDSENFYLRLDPMEKLEGYGIQVNIVGDGRNYKALAFFQKENNYLTLYKDGSQNKCMNCMAVNKIVEIKVPFSEIAAKPGEKINFSIDIKKDKIDVFKYPKRGFISFIVPTKEFDDIMWGV